MPIDSGHVRSIIHDAARAEVVPRFRALARGDVREKQPGDLVTVADEAAEAYLQRRLPPLVAGSVCLGEEAAAEDRGVLDKLSADAPVWVIDPIDGTGNFAAGRGPFAVMVALVEIGVTQAAWIHEPVAGWTAEAVRGQGAWLNGEPLRVSTPVSPGDPASLHGTLHAGQFGSRAMQKRIDRGGAALGRLKSLRCAGAEYVRLARGEQDYSLFTKLEPWDHAPGTLIHTEAGGLAHLLDGTAYTPGRRESEGLLLAPDAATWRTVHDALYPEAVSPRGESGTD